MNTRVIYRQCAIYKSTGNSARGTGSQLWERKPGKVVLRARVIKSQGIDWDYMIGFCAWWSSVYVCRIITSHRPSDNSRNCFINTPLADVSECWDKYRDCYNLRFKWPLGVRVLLLLLLFLDLIILVVNMSVHAVPVWVEKQLCSGNMYPSSDG